MKSEKLSCSKYNVQSEATKRNPEMGETALQPQPAQTADLSISGAMFGGSTL